MIADKTFIHLRPNDMDANNFRSRKALPQGVIVICYWVLNIMQCFMCTS